MKDDVQDKIDHFDKTREMEEFEFDVLGFPGEPTVGFIPSGDVADAWAATQRRGAE